jgi:hypothetical protein
MPIHGQQRAAFEDDAKARLPVLGITHGPVAFAADEVGKDRLGVKKSDYVGKRIAHLGLQLKQTGLSGIDNPKKLA